MLIITPTLIILFLYGLVYITLWNFFTPVFLPCTYYYIHTLQELKEDVFIFQRYSKEVTSHVRRLI